MMAMQFFRDWYVNASPNEKISMFAYMMNKALELEKRNMLECMYDAHLINGHVDEVATDLSIAYLIGNYENNK